MSVVLVFERAEIRFGIPLELLQRVGSSAEIQPLPLPAPDVEGVVTDGNHVIPVIETPLPTCRRHFRGQRLLLVRHGEEPFAFRIDHLEGLMTLEPYPLSLPEALSKLEAGTSIHEGLLSSVLSLSQKEEPPGPVFLIKPTALYRSRHARERV